MEALVKGAERTLSKLAEWEQREGTLPASVSSYQSLLSLQAQAAARFHLPENHLKEEEATGRLSRGLPLLTFGDLALDWGQVRKLMAQVVACLGSQSAVEEMEKVTALDEALVYRLAQAWYASMPLEGMADSLDAGLAASALQASLKPYLCRYAEALLPLVDQEAWRRSYCPICGGKPDFASLDTDRGGRWLLCCRCDAQWLFQRLQCPGCGTCDQQALAYFTDSAGLYRLYTCEHCHTYLKAIDLRQAQGEVILHLERILTLDMDRQALERGYHPVWLAPGRA